MSFFIIKKIIFTYYFEKKKKIFLVAEESGPEGSLVEPPTHTHLCDMEQTAESSWYPQKAQGYHASTGPE